MLNKDQETLLIDSQAALLHVITPNVRGITIEILGLTISYIFYYEFLPSDVELELFSDFEDNLISSFGLSYHFEKKYVVANSQPIALLKALRFWIYLRHEKIY